MIETKPVIDMGASSSPVRTNLQAMNDGGGLKLATTSSGTGDSILISIRIDNTSLVNKTEWKGKFDDMSEKDTKEIQWFDLADRSQIDKLAGNEEQTNKSASKDKVKRGSIRNIEKQIEAEKEAGNIVLKGKFYVFNRAQMLKFQGIDDPNPNVYGPDGEEPYCIIALDSPRKLTFRSGDGQRDFNKIVRIIKIDNTRDYDIYNGKSVIISIVPGKGAWAADTSLPLGEPSADVKILGALGSQTSVNSSHADNNSANQIKNSDQIIRAKNSNMRSEHSKTAPVVKTLLSGTKVHISDIYVESADRIWCKVTL